MARKGIHNPLLASAIKRGLRINEQGQVVNYTGHILKPFISNGYRVIAISAPGGRRIPITVARLTCWQYYGPPPTDSHVVDHRDRDRSNDDPSNLRWVTQSQNAHNVEEAVKALARRNAKNIPARMKLRGAAHAMARTTQEKATEILRLLAEGVPQLEIAARVGLSQCVVSRIKRGAHWILPTLKDHEKKDNRLNP